MNLASKIAGIILCGIGTGIWYIDYLVFAAIGALASWVAGAIGITGAAVAGVQVVGWILILGTLISLFVVGLIVILIGLSALGD